MSRTNRRAAALLALMLVLCLAAPAARAQGDLLTGEQLAPQEVHYNTETVRLGTFAKEETASASVYYPLSYQLGFPHAGAQFVEYKVSRGDRVKAGDVLAEFRMGDSDTELKRLEMAISRAEEETNLGIRERETKIAGARTALALAEEDDRELKELELQRLELELERYRYRQSYSLQQQRAELSAARAERADTLLVAPVDGVITRLANLRADDPVSSGDTVVTMYAESVCLLRVDNSSGNFRYNMPVTVATGTGKNRTELSGRVISADDLLEGVGTGRALVLLEPYDRSISLSNLSVTGQYLYLDNVLLVSRSATTLENGKYYVTKLVDGMVQKRYVVFGQSNSSDIWIVQGVAEGETLVVD